MNTIETIERDSGLVIEIMQDESANCPREQFDHVGTMICFHSSYILGDKNASFNSGDFESWEEMRKAIEDEYGSLACILPLYLYDHSGITISALPFSCHWDSGQIGFIFVSVATMDKEGIDIGHAEKILLSEVEEYNQYLTGQVFGYVLKESDEEDSEILDSCWGFYGEKLVMECAIEAAEYEEGELEKMAQVASYCI